MIVKQEGEVGGGVGGRGREREKVEGELIDKNLSSTSMANLSGREREEGVRRKRKRKEEKRRRGEIKTSQYLRRERIPKQLNHTQKHWEQDSTPTLNHTMSSNKT